MPDSHDVVGAAVGGLRVSRPPNVSFDFTPRELRTMARTALVYALLALSENTANAGDEETGAKLRAMAEKIETEGTLDHG